MPRPRTAPLRRLLTALAGLALAGLAAAGLAAGLAAPVAAQAPWQSALVYEGADGALVYATDAEGLRVPDFSRAGYGGGGVPLPDVPALLTLAPAPGDDTARIQAALNAVGAQTPDAAGFRGAVVLEAGTYEIAGTLRLARSGVVLRGAGDGADPATHTVLVRSGTSQEPVVVLGPSTTASNTALVRRDATREASAVLDARVPIGATALRVARPELYAAGDAVVVLHPSTEAWIAAVGGGGTASDPPWEPGTMDIALARTVVRVDGDRLTLDAPTFAPLDAALAPLSVYHRDRSTVVERVGLEALRIDIQTAGPTSETHAEDAVRFVLVEHAWARDVTALHFWHAGISVQHARYVTVAGCEALEPHSLVTGERRYNFEAARSQLVLFQGNRATEARHAYVGNGETLDSGIVFLDNVSERASTSSESHRRWGTGFLYDNHTEVGSSGSGPGARRLHLGNRGDFGTGHGWACAHCVAWNAQMNGSPVVVEKPPTAQNYAIGTQGVAVDQGPFLANTGAYIEGNGVPGLAPRSLYLRQLADRLATGAAAPPAADAPARLLPVAPNPTTAAATVRFELAAPGAVRLGVSDVLGREVAVLADGARAAGPHAVAFDARRLAAGVYVVTLRAGGTLVARRLTVRR